MRFLVFGKASALKSLSTRLPMSSSGCKDEGSAQKCQKENKVKLFTQMKKNYGFPGA